MVEPRTIEAVRQESTFVIGGLVVVGLLVRICLLWYTGLSNGLEGRVELSTAFTSFLRLKECAKLTLLQIEPYDGDICTHHPFMLNLYLVLAHLVDGELAVDVAYAVADTVTGVVLGLMADEGDRAFVSGIYMLSPVGLIILASKSTAVWHNMLVVIAMALAVHGSSYMSMAFLALATSISMYPALLLPALVMVLRKNARRPGSLLFGPVIEAVSAYVMQLGLLYAQARRLAGEGGLAWWAVPGFVRTVYEPLVLVYDLTPNVGLWWYFFVEMFDDFRAFFLGVFQLHLLIYVAPLCIRLADDPLFAATTLLGLLAVFKPYPTLADTHLYWSLLLLWWRSTIRGRLRYSFILGCGIAFCALFGPAFYHLWIVAGTGNANFFYAITLVWALVQGWLVADVLFAWVKKAYEVEDPTAVGQEIILE
ncbi:hypothetical protein PYCC9005_000104 [Savitreella phatthalungensis]